MNSGEVMVAPSGEVGRLHRHRRHRQHRGPARRAGDGRPHPRRRDDDEPHQRPHPLRPAPAVAGRRARPSPWSRSRRSASHGGTRAPAAARSWTATTRSRCSSASWSGTVQDGRSRVVVLTGEPGIGKSRRRRRARRTRCRRAGSWSAGASRSGRARCCPRWPRRWPSGLGIEPGTAPTAARAAIDAAARRVAPGTRSGALAADLRRWSGRTWTRRAASGTRRTRRGWCWRRGRGSGPVVVVLDDLQWADRALVDLLVDAHRQPWPAPVLLLGLSRTRVRGLPAVTLPGAGRRLDARAGAGPARRLVAVGRGDGSAGVPGERQRAVPRGDGRDARRDRRAARAGRDVDRRRPRPGPRRAGDDPAADRRSPGHAAADAEGAAAGRVGLRHGHVGRPARRGQPRERPQGGPARPGRARPAPQEPAQQRPRHERVRVEARAHP